MIFQRYKRIKVKAKSETHIRKTNRKIHLKKSQYFSNNLLELVSTSLPNIRYSAMRVLGSRNDWITHNCFLLLQILVKFYTMHKNDQNDSTVMWASTLRTFIIFYYVCAPTAHIKTIFL